MNNKIVATNKINSRARKDDLFRGTINGLIENFKSGNYGITDQIDLKKNAIAMVMGKGGDYE